MRSKWNSVLVAGALAAGGMTAMESHTPAHAQAVGGPSVWDRGPGGPPGTVAARPGVSRLAAGLVVPTATGPAAGLAIPLVPVASPELAAPTAAYAAPGSGTPLTAYPRGPVDAPSPYASGPVANLEPDTPSPEAPAPVAPGPNDPAPAQDSRPAAPLMAYEVIPPGVQAPYAAGPDGPSAPAAPSPVTATAYRAPRPVAPTAPYAPCNIGMNGGPSNMLIYPRERDPATVPASAAVPVSPTAPVPVSPTAPVSPTVPGPNFTLIPNPDPIPAWATPPPATVPGPKPLGVREFFSVLFDVGSTP